MITSAHIIVCDKCGRIRVKTRGGEYSWKTKEELLQEKENYVFKSAEGLESLLASIKHVSKDVNGNTLICSHCSLSKVRDYAGYENAIEDLVGVD